MADLKKQLLAYVTQVVDRVDTDDVLSQPVVELQAPTGWPRREARPVWIMAAALIFVVATVGLVPLLVDSSGPPGGTLDPTATTTWPAVSGNNDGALYPDIDAVDDQASLDVTFPDGTTANLAWPEELNLADHGVFVEAAAYTETAGGPDGRVLAIYRGPFEQVADSLGGGTLLDDYPGADGATVEFWRFPAFEWDYLVYQFGGWVVMVYDYRTLAEERMTDEERAMWARNVTGHETSDGFLVLDAADSLRIGGPDFSSPPAIVLQSGNGEVRLEADTCEPSGQTDSWCDASGLIRISTPGAAATFERQVRDGLEVENVAAPASAEQLAESIRGEWLLEAFDGTEVEEGVNTDQVPWIEISDTTFEGNLGCNYFSAAPQDDALGYRLEGDTLYHALVTQNLSFCGYRAEEVFGSIFNPDGIKVTVNEHEMTWRGNSAQLNFTRAD